MRRHATPPWWDWDLVLTPHIKRRMRPRGFSEVDVRGMLESSTGLRSGNEDGRFIAEGRRGSERWEIVLEPDSEQTVIWVITAYRIA
jgi:hypothetical protein